MYSFSKRSRDNLNTCHEDLQTLFNEVIKHRDCTIVSGHRSVEEQFELYRQGRDLPGKIVTYRDGYQRMSNHNYLPSRAVDVVPYPSLYSDEQEIIEFGNFVMGVAVALKECGEISNDVDWGGEWRWIDLPHYEIKQ
jgi:peptidoglycan LD-endopeptidase CwlK